MQTTSRFFVLLLVALVLAACSGQPAGNIYETVAPASLKPGDAIMFSTAAGSDPARVTVIMLLAGVEALLAASPNSTRDIMAGWDLGGVQGP